MNARQSPTIHDGLDEFLRAKEEQLWMERFGLTDEILSTLRYFRENDWIQKEMVFLADLISDFIGEMGKDLTSKEAQNIYRKVSELNNIRYFLSTLIPSSAPDAVQKGGEA